jgi:hypothetical protein
VAHIDVDTAQSCVRILEKFGRTVLIKRGASFAVAIAARGRSPSQSREEERFSTTSDRFRWLIKASDYKVNGVVVLPLEGDKIDDAIPGRTRTWEVRPDGDARHWDYADTGCTYLWVRVKESVSLGF